MQYNVLKNKGVTCMAFSIRITVAEAFKKALFERIEDEYDVTLFEQAMDEYNKNPVTYSHEEVRKMLDL